MTPADDAGRAANGDVHGNPGRLATSTVIATCAAVTLPTADGSRASRGYPASVSFIGTSDDEQMPLLGKKRHRQPMVGKQPIRDWQRIKLMCRETALHRQPAPAGRGQV